MKSKSQIEGRLRPLIWCRACNTERSLADFSLFSEEPLRYYDFCGTCVDMHGAQSLYEKFKDGVDNDVAFFVLSANNDVTPREPIATANKRELARREYCRRRLLYYVCQFSPSYKPGWVHQDVARRLEQFIKDVEDKKCPRLMLFMPPRHGKSTLASLECPSWALGQHPEWEVIIASYNQSLPVGFSREIRDRLRDPRYKVLFPATEMRADSQGVERWSTTKKGGLQAAGVDVGITGKGAHLLIIDDPLRDYEAAKSPTVRETAYNWYTSTSRSRLAPGAGILVIQTRWHDADLSGRLVADMQACAEAGIPENEYDHWTIVSYPAIADADEYLMPDGTIEQEPLEVPPTARLLRTKGAALHPERYSLLELKRTKNAMPVVQWNALYQQNPVPETGEYFTINDFRFVPFLPGTHEEYSFFSAWDLAIGEKTVNDWTVGVVGALSRSNTLYVVDMFRARVQAQAIVDGAIEMGVKFPLLQVLGMEQGQIYKTMEPLLKAAMQTRKSTFSLYQELKPVTDKMLRARPLQSRMQMGQLYFLEQPWARKAQQEMLRFPNGTFDDIVDALAWLARMALVVSPPQSATKRKKLRKSWKEELPGHTRTARSSYMTA